jgi:hypothetical protein
MRPYGSVRGAVSDGRPYRDTDTPSFGSKSDYCSDVGTTVLGHFGGIAHALGSVSHEYQLWIR